ITDLTRGLIKASRGDPDAAKDFLWAAVDLLFLGLPFIGPGARGALALRMTRTGFLIPELIPTVEGLQAASVAPSAIYAMIRSWLELVNSPPNFDFAKGGGGNTGSSGSSGNSRSGPGEWVAEDQSSWSQEARDYQARVTGHPGEAYMHNGVRFDGW